MHAPFLLRCLTLAEQGRGKTGINPMVGVILVRDGKIIAEGFHEAFGKAHAERHLLEKFDPTSPQRLRGASQKIDSKDILYLNLEPCCHEKKKTPPCAQLLIERGVRNVVIGMLDPNPKVAGKGIELLRSAGVNVDIAFGMTADCLRLNRGYVSLMTKGRPWITLKSARTPDGKFSNADGSPLTITSPEQDRWSHQFLRARHDAILVGVGTILTDNPQLTVRFPSPGSSSEPGGGARGGGLRIILDPRLRAPLDAYVIADPFASRTIVITTPDADEKKRKELATAGARLFTVPLSSDGMFDWSALWKVLTTPTGDFFGITSVLVEGGAKTWEAFREATLVDEEMILIG